MPLPTYSEIEAHCHQLGFHQLGVLHQWEFQNLSQAAERLKSWLGNQYHADMAWMEHYFDKRTNPFSLMDGTQAILCVTMNYNPGRHTTQGPVKIARYAQGDDYHRELKHRLKQLLAWLQSHEPTLEGRALTDSAPIMEKALATQAGLGWQGKHSNLITRNIGSWVFLGELLLNQPIPDAPTPQPSANFCGTCRRCIDACPTQAIIDDAQVDANKCISYWTIEHKGDDIPDSIVNKLDGWVFGCDICQDVCPWNLKFEQPTPIPAFEQRSVNQSLTIEGLLALDEAGFKAAYKHSSLKRPKLRGIQRNARALARFYKQKAD